MRRQVPSGVPHKVNGLVLESLVVSLCFFGQQDYPKDLSADAKIGFTVINQVSLPNIVLCSLPAE